MACPYALCSLQYIGSHPYTVMRRLASSDKPFLALQRRGRAMRNIFERRLAMSLAIVAAGSLHGQARRFQLSKDAQHESSFGCVGIIRPKSSGLQDRQCLVERDFRRSRKRGAFETERIHGKYLSAQKDTPLRTERLRSENRAH